MGERHELRRSRMPSARALEAARPASTTYHTLPPAPQSSLDVDEICDHVIVSWALTSDVRLQLYASRQSVQKRRRKHAEIVDIDVVTDDFAEPPPPRPRRPENHRSRERPKKKRASGWRHKPHVTEEVAADDSQYGEEVQHDAELSFYPGLPPAAEAPADEHDNGEEDASWPMQTGGTFDHSHNAPQEARGNTSPSGSRVHANDAHNMPLLGDSHPIAPGQEEGAAKSPPNSAWLRKVGFISPGVQAWAASRQAVPGLAPGAVQQRGDISMQADANRVPHRRIPGVQQTMGWNDANANSAAYHQGAAAAVQQSQYMKSNNGAFVQYVSPAVFEPAMHSNSCAQGSPVALLGNGGQARPALQQQQQPQCMPWQAPAQQARPVDANAMNYSIPWTSPYPDYGQRYMVPVYAVGQHYSYGAPSAHYSAEYPTYVTPEYGAAAIAYPSACGWQRQQQPVLSAHDVGGAVRAVGNVARGGALAAVSTGPRRFKMAGTTTTLY